MRLGMVDHFEVVVIVGASFLVNSVTQDGWTNWAEGLIMVGYYTIIVSTSPTPSSYEPLINLYRISGYRGVILPR